MGMSYEQWSAMVLEFHGTPRGAVAVQDDDENEEVVLSMTTKKTIRESHEDAPPADPTIPADINVEHLHLIGAKWAAKKPVYKELRQFGLFDRWEEVRGLLVDLGYRRNTIQQDAKRLLASLTPVTTAALTAAPAEPAGTQPAVPSPADQGTIVRIYTTAPEVYDGFSTHTINPNVGIDCGKTTRLVECEKRDEDWQRSRYFSGLHSAYDQKSWDGLVASGLVVLP